MLSGDKNIEYEILNKLDDESLVNYFLTNKTSRNISFDDYFWLSRVVNKFPYINGKILRKNKKRRSWSQYYIEDLSLFNNRFNNRFDKTKKDNPNELLLKSSEEGRLDHVIITFKNGANIDHQDHYGQTVLILASARGYINIVKYLFKEGADINHQNYTGYTALILASYNKFLDIVKYLIKEGADINLSTNYGTTALMMASSRGYLDVVKYLIKEGADTSIQNNYGGTALMIAEKEGHSEVAEFLKKIVTN